MELLRSMGPDLWIADGPAVSFFGLPYPTRMAVARLRSGELWVWSPVQLRDELVAEIEALGRVRYLVSPNKLHHLYLGQWKRAWPDARLYASPGLARRRRDLAFDAALGDEPDAAWSGEIDQVVFGGSWVMNEVVFLHRPSGTALVADLIQRMRPESLPGWQRVLFQADGLLWPKGGTPREWRLTFWNRRKRRAALRKLLAWNAGRLVIAHGECAGEGAGALLQEALAWAA